ncbi:MAG: Flp1 family type IVb pilin [Mobilitalea sp.]
MMERIKRSYWSVGTKQLDGVGVIEVILILVVIIGLVLLFREQIGQIIEDAFDAINGDTTGIRDKIVIEKE